MAGRDAIAQIVIGKQGVGKSYTTNMELKLYQKKFQRPVLIVDKKGEYTQYKAVAYDSRIKNRHKRAHGGGKGGKMGLAGISLPRIYRIVGIRPDGIPMDKNEMVELLLTISQYYRNGMLILEEMNSYIRRTVPEEFYSFITTLRHNGVDAIYHFQAAGDAHPDIWRQITILRLHKSNDSVNSIMSKSGFGADRYELAKIAELSIYDHYQNGMMLKKQALAKYGKPENFPKQVQNEIDKHIYYMLYVNFDTSQILGINPDDFKTHCTKFLYQERKQIKDLMYIEDENGKKLYKNKNQAVEKLVNDKMLVYIQ
jgi:hypothetical protein